MDAHKNLAVTLISVAPTPASSGTSVTVDDASVFPATPFNVTIGPADQIPTPANAEIARVTAIVGNVLTIARAQEGTTARAIVVGDLIANAITAKALTDIEAAIPSTAGLLSAINVSAGGAAQNLSALTFSNANGVSFGLNASVLTATVATNYQSQGAYLTTAALSQDSSKYAGTNGAIMGGSITVNTDGVSVNLPAYLTTAALSQDSSKYAGTGFTSAGNNISLSGTLGTNGLSLSASVAAPGGGFQSAGFSTQGNTSGNTGFASQSLQLVGGNNITLSGSTGAGGVTLTISGANAGGAQTGISGIAVNGATATSGTVLFSNANGVSFGLNGNTVTASIATTYAGTGFTSAGNNIGLSGTLNTAGLSLSATVAAQTNQSAIKGFGVSNTGQTAGNTGISTGIDWALAGSGSITLSQSTAVGGPNTVWIQHPAWITTAAQSNQVVQSINGSTGTFSFNTGSSLSSSRNGNAITFGLASDITSALQSAGAYLTTADLSANSSKYVQNWKATGNTAGTTSSAVGTDLWFSGGNGVTISGSSGSLVFSVATNYLTTAAQSNQVVNSINGSTGTFSFNTGSSLSSSRNGNAITFGLASDITTALQSAGAYLTTADLSANSSKYVQNWKLTGNTAGTTSSAQGTDVWLSGGQGITISGSNNSIVFSVGSYITTARASTDGIGLNTAKTNVTWTVNSSGFSLDAGGYAGTGFTSTTTAGVDIKATNNTVGISMAVPAFLTTAMASNRGSDFVAATAAFSGVNATGTINSTGITVSVAAPGAAAEANWVNLLGANTLGNTTASGSTIGWSGGPGVTLSGANNSQVVISIKTDYLTTAMASNRGSDFVQATAAFAGTNASGTIASNGVSVSVAAPPYNGWLEPYPLLTATQTLAPAAGSWYLAPFTAFGSVSGGRVNLLAINTGTAALFQDLGETAYKSNTTGTLSQRFTFEGRIALFSQGTGTNSTRLESVWSNSHSWGWSKVLNVSTNAASNIAVSLAQSISYQSEIGSDGQYTNVQYANAGSSTIANSSGASTALSTVFSSGRNLISGSIVQPFGLSTTLTAGVYWLGYAWSTTRATATTGGQLGSAPDFGFSGLLGMSRLAVDSLYRNFGSTVTTARSQLIPYGVYTGAANMAPPTGIALSSDLSSLASQWVPYFAFNNRGLTK